MGEGWGGDWELRGYKIFVIINFSIDVVVIVKEMMKVFLGCYIIRFFIKSYSLDFKFYILSFSKYIKLIMKRNVYMNG